MTDQPVILECRGLWKLYGAQADGFLAKHGPDASADAVRRAGLVSVVRNVDASIRRGEIFVIMGLSGSGKSTLVRCLARLIEATAGEIHFEGQDLLKMKDVTARAGIQPQ